MENRANYTLVGGFVLAVIFVGIAFVVWLAGVELKQERTLYQIYFRGSVAGLSEGSTVRLRGVPVGTVTRIAIDPANVEIIEVTVAIRPGTPIKTDTVASLAAQGITGLVHVNLTGGSNAAPPLTPRDGRRYAVIASVQSTLDRLVEEAPNMIATANTIALQTAKLFSDENIARVGRILDHAENVAAGVAAQRGQIEPFLGEARLALETVQWLVLDARDSIGRLEKDTAGTLGDARTLMRGTERIVTGLQPSVADLRQGAQSLARLSRELEGIVQDGSAPTRSFLEGGLYEFSQFVVEARQLVAALQRLSLLFERDPARFMFGDQSRGFDPARQAPAP
jgi:phospholipid/cholesterol/gamma-HCH transport system substrate-binding protein